MAADSLPMKKHYILATRLPFSSASVLPAILAAVWGWINRSESFNFVASILGVLGVLFVHLAANTINDYFDWDASDKINKFPTPFSGGSRWKLERVLKKESFLWLTIALIGLALLCAFILAIEGRTLVFAIGALGALCGFLYSIYPFSMQSRGIGEFLIFLAFGPLITFGMGYVCCDVLSPEFFVIGIPNGFVVANILWINEFPDYEADLLSGKRNMVVRLGTSKARYGFALLFGLFYLSTFFLVWQGIFPVITCIVIIVLPLAIKAILIAWKNHSNPREIVPAQGQTIIFQSLSAILTIISLFVSKYI